METVCAFANTDGGSLVLGMDDGDKSQGMDRLVGINENREALDDLERKLRTHLTPPVTGIRWQRIPFRHRDGVEDHVALLTVGRSPKVHSVTDSGTFMRMDGGNRHMSAEESTELSFRRGVISAENAPVAVPLELLDTPTWAEYCDARAFRTRQDIGARMLALGLAKQTAGGGIQPLVAAVLLFADDPNGVLAAYGQTRAAIRIFHYAGTEVVPTANPNLVRAPKTIGGPLIRQINAAHRYVLDELARGLVMAASGFKTQHAYPERVIREAITNAVVHRDYRLSRDIHIRIFDDRIEVDSPGQLPGNITPQTIFRAGSLARNAVLVSHLREFPNPPNVDAGEGVRMMLHEMRAVDLFPPSYAERGDTAIPSVVLTLLNENLPQIWDQVSDWLERNGSISNRKLTEIAEVDTLRASKMFKRWVQRGLLVKDESLGRAKTVYRKPPQTQQGLPGIEDH